MRRVFNPEKKIYTLAVIVEDIPGILSQVARLFSRKGYNIESIVSGATDRQGITRISIELLADELMIDQIAAQCRKLLGVKAVKILDEKTSIRREIAFIKVRAAERAARDEILQIAKTGTIAIERGHGTIYDDNKLQEEFNYGKNVL